MEPFLIIIIKFKIMKKIILLTTIAFVLFSCVTPIFAAGLGSANSVAGSVAGKAGVTEKNIEDVVGTGINAALSLVGLIFLILMVYAGYLWMTARGEEETIKKAQKIIISTIIGLIITLSAYAITKFVTGRF
jgi:hypothetical protein